MNKTRFEYQFKNVVKLDTANAIASLTHYKNLHVMAGEVTLCADGEPVSCK